MVLSDRVHTFGQAMIAQYGERVHKIAIDAGFSCPNRDGTKGRRGCTFCNNVSFSPNGRRPKAIQEQINSGRDVINRRTGAKKFLAYFQAYTNTHATVMKLKSLYDEALSTHDIVGLSVGTRPDCVPASVLDLLAEYQQHGNEVWLELGLQSSFDHTLELVNRGHNFADYVVAIREAKKRNLKVCTHLIVGLPGESKQHSLTSLARVLELGVDGLKLHPLHVVKGTQIANSWRRGELSTLTQEEYIQTATELIEMTPVQVLYHRLTATANRQVLLAPQWCQYKWRVINGIEKNLRLRNSSQGKAGKTHALPTGA